MGTFGDLQGDTLVTSINVDSFVKLLRDTLGTLHAHSKIYFGNKQTHWMNPNKEYHDLIQANLQLHGI